MRSLDQITFSKGRLPAQNQSKSTDLQIKRKRDGLTKRFLHSANYNYQVNDFVHRDTRASWKILLSKFCGLKLELWDGGPTCVANRYETTGEFRYDDAFDHSQQNSAGLDSIQNF